MTKPGNKRGAVVGAIEHFDVIIVTVLLEPVDKGHMALASPSARSWGRRSGQGMEPPLWTRN